MTLTPKEPAIAAQEATESPGKDVPAADADALGAQDREAAVARTAAGVARDHYAVKVAERQMLQARVEASALRGDVEAANQAWDRLFDMVTAIRGAEGKPRRAGQPDPRKVEDYHAAREDSLKIRQWARDVQVG